MEITSMRLTILVAYIIGAGLVVWGGTGLLRELIARRRGMYASTALAMHEALKDVESVSRMFEISGDGRRAARRIAERHASGVRDVVSESAYDLRELKISEKEMQIQNRRGENAAAAAIEAMADLKRKLHGVHSDSLANQTTATEDEGAARAFMNKLRVTRRDALITLLGVLLTTGASCLSLFIS